MEVKGNGHARQWRASPASSTTWKVTNNSGKEKLTIAWNRDDVNEVRGIKVGVLHTERTFSVDTLVVFDVVGIIYYFKRWVNIKKYSALVYEKGWIKSSNSSCHFHAWGKGELMGGDLIARTWMRCESY